MQVSGRSRSRASQPVLIRAHQHARVVSASGVVANGTAALEILGYALITLLRMQELARPDALVYHRPDSWRQIKLLWPEADNLCVLQSNVVSHRSCGSLSLSVSLCVSLSRCPCVSFGMEQIRPV